MKEKLIEFRKEGIYCPKGDFYIDPKRAVTTAIITHAHTDHGIKGHKHCIAHPITAALLEYRYGKTGSSKALPYGEVSIINDVAISLHPAGHVPGSAQVRVSFAGETWVISGDYKRAIDSVSTPFEPVPCDVFITESTFALPVYRWEEERQVFHKIHEWWMSNKKQGKISILLGYSLGKAQRLLAGLDQSIGSIHVHQSIGDINTVLKGQGVMLPDAPILVEPLFSDTQPSLIIAPPASQRGKWLKDLGPVSVGYVSGWMALEKTPWYIRSDARFALSDHADFFDLVRTVQDTGAKNVYTMHGYAKEFATYLSSIGIEAYPIPY